ncbi:MAG: hypothetical protein ACYDBJ_12170 [Aggregatilineales bacterium]
MPRIPPTRRHRIADQNGVLIAAAIMAGGGYALLYELVMTTNPLAFPRWMFFILLYVAATGTALPFAWILNRRFTRRLAAGGVLLRESMLVGLYVVTAAWLQMTRTFNTATGFFLALSLIVIEGFLRLRERPRDGP